jgi:hypothetical protein
MYGCGWSYEKAEEEEVSVIVALGRSRHPLSLNQRRNPRRSYCFVRSFNHEGGQQPISCSFFELLTSLHHPPTDPTPLSILSMTREHERDSTTTVLPTPNILGQIVEIAFLLLQARKALSTMSDRRDVYATLESLLNLGAASGSKERERELSSTRTTSHHLHATNHPSQA